MILITFNRCTLSFFFLKTKPRISFPPLPKQNLYNLNLAEVMNILWDITVYQIKIFYNNLC